MAGGKRSYTRVKRQLYTAQLVMKTPKRRAYGNRPACPYWCLGKELQITDSVAPHTARLHLTLIGLKTSTPVLSTATHVLPAGIVVNAGLGASGHNGTFFGSVCFAAELYDATTGGRAFRRGELYVGFAWNLRVMIYTSHVSDRDTV